MPLRPKLELWRAALIVHIVGTRWWRIWHRTGNRQVLTRWMQRERNLHYSFTPRYVTVRPADSSDYLHEEDIFTVIIHV